jgi:hypothetical protein
VCVPTPSQLKGAWRGNQNPRPPYNHSRERTMKRETPLLDLIEEHLRRALVVVEARELGLFTWHDAVQRELSSLGALLEENGWTPSSQSHG